MYDFEKLRRDVFANDDTMILTSEHGDRILRIESPGNYQAMIWEHGFIQWYGGIWMHMMVDISECWIAQPGVVHYVLQPVDQVR